MSGKQIALDQSARADNPESDEARSDGAMEIAPDLAYQRLLIVNVTFFGSLGGEWVLIDAGLFGTKPLIKAAAEKRFGRDAKPSGIILTHGHFDHVGALRDLADDWDVPIYAHPLELPYLDGSASYPAPDPTVGGGLMSLASSLFPRGPIDVGDHLRPLPPDGSIPGMPGWRWIATPGHSPGHVSFWRENDRALIVGDAFVTTRQESVYAALTQQPELHGPPMYYTPDWDSSRASVQTLAALDPEMVVTGHGRAMRGPEMQQGLRALAKDFDRVAVPKHGRYVSSDTAAR